MLSQNFFIEILLQVIYELEYDTFKSIMLIHLYSKIIYDIVCIFNYKLKYSTNNIVKNLRYSWIKTIFYDEKLYNDMIDYININILKEINKFLNSKIIDDNLNDCLNSNLFLSNNYLNFMKFNQKITNEIDKLIKLFIDESFKDLYNKYLITKNENINELINNEEFFKNESFLFDLKDIKYIIKHLNDEHQKMYKNHELVEVLNLSNNVEYEQSLINKSWINIINDFGIIGFWNFILSQCIENNYDYIKQLELFYILNLYLFNGIILSNYLKNIFKNISPYELLKNELFNQNSKNKIWFISDDINLKYINLYDFPSEINLISKIAINIINLTKTNICEVKITLDKITKFKINIDNSNIFIFNEKNNYYLFNCIDSSGIFENLTISYLNCLQSYLTSHHSGREIGNIIYNILNKKLNFIIYIY